MKRKNILYFGVEWICIQFALTKSIGLGYQVVFLGGLAIMSSMLVLSSVWPNIPIFLEALVVANVFALVLLIALKIHMRNK